MKYLINICLTIILLATLNKKSIASKEILFAEDVFDQMDYLKLDFRLFDDSTYIFNYHKKEWSHEKNEMFRGRYYIKFDTINFFPFKFKFIYANKAIIKEGFIEFLNGEQPLRIKIKRTTLNSLVSFDTVKYNKYAFFSFNPNHYNYFTGDFQSIDLDDKELFLLDSIVTTILQNSKLFSYKPEEYYKQCIAVIDSSGDKNIWLNLQCGHSIDFKNEIIETFDGGNCYANFKVNLTKLIFYDLFVNDSP